MPCSRSSAINDKFVVFSEGNLVSNQSPAAGLPAEPVRARRAAPLRRRRQGRPGAPGSLRAGVRQPPRLRGAAGRRRPEEGPGRRDPLRDAYDARSASSAKGKGIEPIPAEAPHAARATIALLQTPPRRRSGAPAPATRWRRARARCGRGRARSVAVDDEVVDQRPSRASAWARIPAGPGATSPARSSGTKRRSSATNERRLGRRARAPQRRRASGGGQPPGPGPGEGLAQVARAHPRRADRRRARRP